MSDELELEVNKAMLPVFEDAVRAVRAVYDAIGGEAGLGRLVEERIRWAAQHPDIPFGQSCHCWCEMRGHYGGVCDEEAVTFEPRVIFGKPHALFLCQPCADAIATERP